MSEVIKLKSALAHVDQGSTNAGMAISTARRIVTGVGMLVGEVCGPDSEVGTDALRWMAEADTKLGEAVAAMAMASKVLRDGVARVNRL